MTINLFTYGTLMNPHIWDKVVSNLYPTRPFTVHDFARRSLKNRPYPGLIEKKGEFVKGLLYVNISPHDLEKIDQYEGEEYERIQINGDMYTYLYIGSKSNVLEQEWEPQF